MTAYEEAAIRILQPLAGIVDGGRLHGLPFGRDRRIRRAWQRAREQWAALRPAPEHAAFHAEILAGLEELAAAGSVRDVGRLQAVCERWKAAGQALQTAPQEPVARAGAAC